MNHMQPGFMMYLPVYRRDKVATNEAQRREMIEGFVFCTFRTYNLLNSIVGPLNNVRREIFDGKSQNPADLIFDSMKARSAASAEIPLFSAISTIAASGRDWGLSTATLLTFEAKINQTSAKIATAATTAICILVFMIIWSLATLRSHANQLAQRMMHELERSRERLALALEKSELALFDWNITTGVVRLSRHWTAILGDESVPITTNVTELQQITHPDDFKILQLHLSKTLKGETPNYQVEHRVRTHDGSSRWILSRGKVVSRDAKDRALRLVGTNADIHECKEIARLKNEFIATMSHELRTPLTGILGALGLIRAGAAGENSI